MKDEEREELSKRSNALRLELKIWEKDFASANNGKKASRDDIKNNPEIGMPLVLVLSTYHSDVYCSTKVQGL